MDIECIVEYIGFLPKKKIAKFFIFKNLAIHFLGWQMGLEPTTFRTTIVLEINIISIIVSQLSVSFIGQ